ncbi:hypothetical protein KEM54_005663 [Ascosphaera aggregata]|nr:hypothetical protein KEM54_005663 [Ascosphaera aggregata]
MAYQPPVADVPVIVTVAGDGTSSMPSERRVTPSWTINVLKGKLETMTGIPPSSQRVKLLLPGRGGFWCDDEMRTIGEFGVVRGAELEVSELTWWVKGDERKQEQEQETRDKTGDSDGCALSSDKTRFIRIPIADSKIYYQVHDLRPPSARPNFTDLAAVEKYTLPPEQYEQLQDSVLHWKKTQKLGRFNPNAPSPEQLLKDQASKDEAAIERNNITLNSRAIIIPSVPPHLRRGTIRYIGPVPSIPSPFSTTMAEHPEIPPPLWVGIELDEPTGKNDGSVNGERYFECLQNRGVFVKPDKVEVGEWPVLGLDEDLEEI